MTREDENKVRQMIVDVIGRPLAEISGQLALLTQTTDVINAKVTVTNGKVAEHEKVIGQMIKDEISHFNKCPNTDKIITLEKMEVGRKAVSNFTWKQVTWIGAVAGTILTLLTILINLIGII